jgi:glycosyltransferase involved in cell wall biosynthesis
MKLLFLTQIPPTLQYTAGFTLDYICRVLPEGSVVNAVIYNPALENLETQTSLSLPFLFIARPSEHYYNNTSKQRMVTNPLNALLFKNNLRALPAIIKQITDFARKHQVEAVMAHLDTPFPIMAALPVAKTLELSLYTMVFDEPRWYMRDIHMAPASVRQVIRNFDEAVAASVCCAVISEPMAKEYAAKYQVRTQLVRPIFPAHLAQDPLGDIGYGEYFYIGLAGQIYAPDSLFTLLNMLDTVNWTLHGRKVVIRYLGKYLPQMSSAAPRHIEWLGWRSQEEVVRYMAECDLLYCPYPFDVKLKDIARLSFPSKIAMYLAVARPILFHGPDYASPVEFFTQTRSALVCTELNPESLLTELNELFTNYSLCRCLSAKAFDAFKTHFSQESLRINVENFLKP